MIKRFRAERFTFAIRDYTYHSKILQVIFNKSDGSLFVNFPYFTHSKGLASIATLKGGTSFPNTISLIDGGKVTSHLVKYTHHPDGKAHFSQDGKVKTLIKKQSIPLDQVEDHIFTVQLQGLQGFKNISDRDFKLPNKQKTLLNFEFNKLQSAGFKIVGRWYSNEQLESRSVGYIEGPRVIGERPDGKQIQGFLIAAPATYPLSNYVLFVTCEWIPRLNDEETVLTFIGGFDLPQIVNNHSIDTTFLTLSYPASNYTELEARIGSLDFRKSAKQE